jgi:hypothetical protein
MKTKYEVADIVRAVDTSKGFSFHQQKAFKDILECRTEALGGHANVCSNDDCDNSNIAYNSCRNRACPKCGWKKNQDWILKLCANIFPCKHFHTIFTIPHEFNLIYLYNKSTFSNIIFDSSREAVLNLIKSKWKVKGGCTSVLHTWGSALNIHPHVHMVVPAGGFCLKTGVWKGFRKHYLANKKALAFNFRTIFMEKIKNHIYKNKLILPPALGFLSTNYADFLDFFHKPHSKKWNVEIKKAFGSETQVIKYLGRYIHRTAISNSRILDIDLENNKVLFQFKNYKSGKMDDVMSLDLDVFVRRLSYHTCEKGFQRIRNSGIYGNAVKTENVFQSRLKVYGDWRKPVCVLKEIYKIKRKISSVIDSISICSCCGSEFDKISVLEYQNTA